MVASCCERTNSNLPGLDQRRHRRVGVDLGRRVSSEQGLLAIEVGLAQPDCVGAHLDLVFVADVRGAQVLKLDARSVLPALGEGQRRLERRGIDVEQRIAGLHLLAFDDVDGDDRTRHQRRDERLVGADCWSLAK